MGDDWDLQAVVRGCSSISSSSTSTSTPNPTTTTSSTTSLMADSQSNSITISPFGTQQLQSQIFSTLTDPTSSRTNLVEELHELYKPFFTKSDQVIPSLSPQSTTPTSSLSSISASVEQRKSTKQQNQTKASHVPSVNNPRSKKRKNQFKRICQVAAENISLDIWSWRKYGQKPIKGSPYPRGYYKCSSSKGCLARKQVERNISNPKMFTVTYTADHNHTAPTHRNSLAGSTRQKSVTNVDSNKLTTKSLSPATSLEEDLVLPETTDTESKLENLLGDEEEEDELGFSDMTMSDDFFEGLEGLVVPATEDYFSDN